MPRTVFLAVLATLAVLAFAAPASASSHTAITPFAIIDNNSGSPQSRVLNVYGESGLITDVDVTFDELSHTNPDDLDMVLVSPAGTVVWLLSDKCGTVDVVGADWTFNDSSETAPFPDAGPCPDFANVPPSEQDADAWAITP